MLHPLKLLTMLLLLIAAAQILPAQEKSEVLILQNKKTGKEKVVAPNSKFKAKNQHGIKMKGRITELTDSYLVSDKNDTLFYNKVRWIKAKKELTKMQRGAGIVGLFAGTFYTPVVLMGTTLSYLMAGTSPVIFLVNAVPVGATIISVRTLGGRRYKMENWQLYLRNSGISPK